MPTVIELARQVAIEYLENISIYDIQSITPCSTEQAEQIRNLILIAEVKV